MTEPEHLHRHAYAAWEDFARLRKLLERFAFIDAEEEQLWHSCSHHLRHAVYRSGREVDPRARRHVRRRSP